MGNVDAVVVQGNYVLLVLAVRLNSTIGGGVVRIFTGVLLPVSRTLLLRCIPYLLLNCLNTSGAVQLITQLAMHNLASIRQHAASAGRA